MYVQTYLDLSHREVSCCLLFFPWLVQLSLAGGFLVAVAGCALVAVACCLVVWLLLRDFFTNGPVCLFHLLTCTMGFAPIKRTGAA